MPELGKMLFILGLVICGVGLVLWSGTGAGWFGRLPGDVRYSRGNFSIYFPLATCLLLSVVLTLLTWLLRK
jgi:hypothetical protein